MAICKQCGKDILDGDDLCEECAKRQSNSPVTDESYLDNLLQKLSEPEIEQNKVDSTVVNENLNLTDESSEIGDVDLVNDTLEESIDLTLEDIMPDELEENDFQTEVADIWTQLEDIDSEKDVLDETPNNNLEDINSEILEDVSLDSITLDGLESFESEEVDPKDLENEKIENNENIIVEEEENEEAPSLEPIEEQLEEQLDEMNPVLLETEINEGDNLEDLELEVLDLEPENLEDMNLDSLELIEPENLDSEEPELEEELENLLPESNMEVKEVKEKTEEEMNDFDDTIENLLNDLDNEAEVPLPKEELLEEEDTDTFTESEKSEEKNAEDIIESDPMEDVEDLLELLASETIEVGNDSETDEQNLDSIKTDEEVFSLDGMDNIEDLLSDVKESVELEDEKTDKAEIFHELDDLGESLENDILGELPSKEELKIKKGILQKLFGNIFDAKSKKAQKKAELVEEKNVQKKAEKKKIKAEKVAAKNDPAVKAEKEAAKKEKAEKKAAIKATKEAKKKEKEEKKRERLEQEEAEAKEDQGRINPIGASIVFVLAGVFTVFVIFGSKNFSYTQSVVKANEYFTSREYNEAYDEVKGISVKDKDAETYDKIMTVMYVNKQLNSYNNYYAMQMYPQALDSLLKGLKKYDKYIDIAKKLGITSDFEYVREQILKEMNHIFKLSKKDAYKIINNDNQELYSQKVIETAEKNIEK